MGAPLGTVPSSHLGGIGLDLVLTRLHHTMIRTPAKAAPPSVIGGPGSDLTRDAFGRPLPAAAQCVLYFRG